MAGVHSRTFTIRDKSCNYGLASDGAVMAVSNGLTHKVTVFSLADGAVQAEFGGYGSGAERLSFPVKMCLNPRNGNLLILDCDNHRVQVMR